MATTSNTTKAKQDLTRTRSLGRKPKQPSSVSSEDGSSDQKPEKPLPNYLKPTISSRSDPVKFLKKNNNNLDDNNQKLLRRRSFDRPLSSLTCPPPSSSYSSPSPSPSPSPRIQKSLNVSQSPRDRPTVSKEKPLRSSSFHGSRGVPRGGGGGGSTSVKSPHVAPKKSGLSSSSTSLKSKKETSGNVSSKKPLEKEIALDTASLSSVHEDEEEILKVENVVQVSNDVEESKDEKEDGEVQEEVVQADESNEEIENVRPTIVASPLGEDCIDVNKEEEEEKLINEEKTEETKEKDDNDEVKEDVTKKIDEDETPEKVEIDMKEVETIEKTTEEKEEENAKEEEKEKVKEEEEKGKEEDSGEVKKREVVKGKKESPSAYNDVIASKIQENPRKNKVLALAGAFQTVIDYETAASK